MGNVFCEQTKFFVNDDVVQRKSEQFKIFGTMQTTRSFFTELTNFPKAIKNQVFLLNNRSVKENEQNRLKIKDSFMNERNQSLLNV